MKTTRSILNNEQGSAIIMALFVLALITVLGFAASEKSSGGAWSARNMTLYKQNLYAADSAAMIGAQALENELTATELDPSTTTKAWIFASKDDMDDLANADNWSLLSDMDVVERRGEVNTLKYAVVGWTGVRSASLSMTGVTSKSKVRACEVYGRYESDFGRSTVIIGYKKRF